MRKTLLALILVIPMIFVIVIFSSVNLVSLGVNISVSGIELRSENVGKDGSILINMAEDPRATVFVEVFPGNATEKGYTLSSSDPDVAEVTQDGLIVPKGEGTAEIVATSNDKGFTDSIPVVVVSSRAYDFDFKLTAVGDGEKPAEDLLEKTDDGYRTTHPISTGTYTYDMDIHPMEFTDYSIDDDLTGVYAEIEKGRRSIFLPFSGEVEFNVTVKGGIDGDIVKTVHLDVEKPSSSSVIINGDVVDDKNPFGKLPLTKGTRKAKLYVECSGGKPEFSAPHAGAKRSGSGGRYTFDITFDEDVGNEIEATLTAGGRDYPVFITFEKFTFSVFSDRTVETLEDGTKQVSILADSSVTFYAVAAGGATGVEYRWSFTGPADCLTVEEDVATISSAPKGEHELTVTAFYGEEEEREEYSQIIKVVVINKVSAVKINNDVKCGLAECYTIAGMVYDNALKTVKNAYPLLVYTYTSSGFGLAGDDISYTLSDDTIAAVEMRGGSPVLIPKATGTVTVIAAWKGNGAFGKNVQGSLKLNVVAEAVEVKNAPELTAATDAGLPVVLTRDIKLGTDANGQDFTVEEREAVLKTHLVKSTYNTEWYKYTHEQIKDERITGGNVNISYAMEFKNDVYGNGKSIDASNFTHCHDTTGDPKLDLYRGPLYFVAYSQMASVAAQDNCAFLIRTDGVKLYGVNLLGCSDELLTNPETGQYDLTQLNLTGTTLEVNASAEIVNCRIRNGRNVVRAYGGNRSGDKYFIDSLSQNAEGVDSERIHVKIEGCILAQGREFILKIGANRALRASLANNNQQPALVDQSGRAYNDTNGNNIYGNGKLYEDPWFYKQYVMTDVTLKDSVLETSGLFTVGIESNFAGEFLYPGGESYRGLTTDWEHSGGTSFASVLHLEGNVRLYDWKDILLVDSSTLIESPSNTLSGWLKLNIASMLEYVTGIDSSYKGLIETTSDGKKFVHGGIAYYGGGRNYSCLEAEKLDSSLSDFTHVNVNIGMLANGNTPEMQQQGSLLPKAAGTHDFNFYMYGKDSANDFVKQKSDEQKGIKYKDVLPVPLFAD